MLFELLERQSLDRASHAAVICEDASITWRELFEQAARLAGGLRAWGVEEGEAVAVLLPNSPMLMAAMLASARIGAQVLPLGVDLKAPEVVSVLEAAQCRTLLAADSLSDLVRQILASGVRFRAIQNSREDFGMPSLARLAADSPIAGKQSSASGAPFMQLLTSGTTGQPKRIVRTQAALCALAAAYCDATSISADDRILGAIPLYHGHGLCNGFLAPLYSGATLILQPAFDRRRTLRLLEDERITVFSAPPFMFSLLAGTLRREPFASPHLRLTITAGAPLDRAAWHKVRDTLGISLRQLYGASETGVVAINMDARPEESIESVGRPLSGVAVAIRDAAGRDLPAGAQGEIAVKSPAAAGWSATLDAGPTELKKLADDQGWILMADEGRFDLEGRLYVTGRTSLFLNIAGRRVNPAQVEAVILSHPKVQKVSIVPMADAYGNQVAKAVVVCSGPCEPEELVVFCRERLANYKVPRVMEIVKCGASFPRLK
ncbi:MAG: acyl--CoA ligase [Candidatus Solibacter usitatus]|nr:acyl--CoA ligase [Candidatus Solibacter usitatus]